MSASSRAILDAFVTERYDHLVRMSRSITKRRRVDDTDSEELLSYLFEHLYSSPAVERVVMQGRPNLEGYAVGVMTNAWRWGKTPNQVHRRVTSPEAEHAGHDEPDEPDLEDRLRGLTDLQVERLLAVERRCALLEPHERKLYQMYYVEELTMRQIAARVNLSHIAIYHMVVVMKNKLRGEVVVMRPRVGRDGQKKMNEL